MRDRLQGQGFGPVHIDGAAAALPAERTPVPARRLLRGGILPVWWDEIDTGALQCLDRYSGTECCTMTDGCPSGAGLCRTCLFWESCDGAAGDCRRPDCDARARAHDQTCDRYEPRTCP